MVACTSTMELGIDVGDLDLILQYNAPNTVSSFLQRLGRTGRREGKTAHYEFLIVNKEALLKSIALVELARRQWVESVHFPLNSYHVLIQQVFSIIRENDGASQFQLLQLLKFRQNFSGISKEQFIHLLEEMVSNNYLALVDGKYFLSDKLDEKFARKNYLEICSVFETVKEFTVKHQNRDIGSLDSWFVNIYYKENEPFIFVLNGLVWKGIEIDFNRYIIHVQEAEKGAIPIWQGSGQKISFEIAQQILLISSSYEDYPYIDQDASRKLKEYRTNFHYFGMKPGMVIIEEDSKGYTIYTFAGDMVNYTLATLLREYTGAEIKTDYQKVKLKIEDYPYNLLEKYIEKIKYGRSILDIKEIYRGY
ncbi:hypothetical protein AP3564_00945 [Aeribacillus pallidus]|uniref:Helicase C-terminal domain-containing protein n=2 Tax=Aeribacillus pallidus TaxID=33936 RepID=A0A223E178_9BACI|nr:hypothetical protein AP3564_00945 [Aeribacillus pallidus]